MTEAQRLDLLGRYRAQLLRFARSRLGNPAHAEDAVQETMLAALENIGRFSGESSFSTWLTGILKHKIVDCVRRSAREQWQEMDNDGTPLGPEDMECANLASGAAASRGWDEPCRELERNRRLDALERCIQQLPARTAETFILREVVGLSTAEASRALAVSETNCAVMLHRARARIRASLDPEWVAA